MPALMAIALRKGLVKVVALSVSKSNMEFIVLEVKLNSAG